MRSTMPVTVRVGTGLAVLAAGAIHLWLWWMGGYRHAPGLVGPAFVADACASAVVGTLVLARGDRRAAWAGCVLAALALMAYLLARTIGLSGFIETRWTRPSLAAAGCEAIALVLLLTEALLPDELPSGPRERSL